MKRMLAAFSKMLFLFMCGWACNFSLVYRVCFKPLPGMHEQALDRIFHETLPETLP